MIRIEASEKYLSFNGYASDAIALVDSLHEAYYDKDMPKVLNDFVFNLDIRLKGVKFSFPLTSYKFFNRV